MRLICESETKGELNVMVDKDNVFLEVEIPTMLDDTSKLLGKKQINHLSSLTIAANESNALVSDVEFWKWMDRNYYQSQIFESSGSMQEYIAQSSGKEGWMIKQLQGKGYEWDWMSSQRANVKNIFQSYDAGDVANRAASDVTQSNLLTGSTKEFQMKAYTSKATPHLESTPTDMTVVTNVEKVEAVKVNGYENVEEFQDTSVIKGNTNKRLEKIKQGKAYSTYSVKNVAGTMAKAGAIGCVVGIGTEAVLSYKKWKNGEISDENYIGEILKSGGEVGTTAATTGGVMIPVSGMITSLGVSSLINIPVAFVLSGVVNKVVAPCFGRGKFAENLSKAEYYQSLEDVYDNLVDSMETASNQYVDFVRTISKQKEVHELLKDKSMDINKELEILYEKI